MYTHSYSFNTDICLHIHSAECTVRLLNQAGMNNYQNNPKYVGNTGVLGRNDSPTLYYTVLVMSDCDLTLI